MNEAVIAARAALDVSGDSVRDGGRKEGRERGEGGRGRRERRGEEKKKGKGRRRGDIRGTMEVGEGKKGALSSCALVHVHSSSSRSEDETYAEDEHYPRLPSSVTADLGPAICAAHA